MTRKADNPSVPVAPAEQIESTHEAFAAGASTCAMTAWADTYSTLTPLADPSCPLVPGRNDEALPNNHASVRAG